MRTSKTRVSHKHFQLDSVKIRRGQKVLRAKTQSCWPAWLPSMTTNKLDKLA